VQSVFQVSAKITHRSTPGGFFSEKQAQLAGKLQKLNSPAFYNAIRYSTVNYGLPFKNVLKMWMESKKLA
jgi:hypothetical protein